MDEIYKSARLVIAWLGPEDPFTPGAVRIMEYIASIFPDVKAGNHDQFESKIRDLGTVDLKMLDDFSAIINRAYFSRA